VRTSDGDAAAVHAASDGRRAVRDRADGDLRKLAVLPLPAPSASLIRGNSLTANLSRSFQVTTPLKAAKFMVRDRGAASCLVFNSYRSMERLARAGVAQEDLPMAETRTHRGVATCWNRVRNRRSKRELQE